MRRRSILFASLAAALVMPAQARESASVLSPEQRARVEMANTYLSGLQSVRGRFTQSDPQGALSSGTLWLRRPGRARFQYDPPADLLVVSDGYNVTINDRRLKTFDQYPLGMTPLGLLLARQVRLEKGVVVTSVNDIPGGFSMTARNERKSSEGSITLLFATKPLSLTGWVVMDGQGQRTQIALGTLEGIAEPDPNLFVLRNPKPRSGKP